MRSISMKRKLEKELPYPKITPRANCRIDQVLAALPDKEPTAEAAASIEDWDDFSQFVPMEEEKRSVAGAVFRWAAVCAAAVFVSLVALNILSPQTAESLPGVGHAFKSVNSFLNGETGTPAPVPSPSPSPSASPTVEAVACSPLPVEDNGTKLTKIERDGSAVTITAEIPYMGRVRESLRSDDYFDYTLLGSTAQLTRFGEDSQLADSTEVEGERMENLGWCQVLMQSHGGRDQAGETRSVTWTFQNAEIPENGQMVLTLFEKAPRSEGELNLPNRVTAQFVVDLNAQKAAPADYSREMGFVKAAPEEVLAAPKLGEFTKGWYATEPTVAHIDERMAGLNTYYKDTEYYKVVFYQKDVDVRSISDITYKHPEWEPAALRVYLDGELKTEITALSRKDLEDSGVEFTRRDGGFLDESIANAKYNELENGVVYDDTRWFTHGDYRRLAFGVPASVLGAKEGELEGLLSRLRFAFECNGEEVFFDAVKASKEQQAQADENYAAWCYVDEPNPSRERMVMQSDCTHTDGKNPALCPTPNLDASQYSCYIQLFINTVAELDDWEIYVEQADGTATTFPLTPGDTSVQPPEANIDEEDMWHPLASGPMYRLDWRTPTPDEYEEWVTVNLWKGLDLPRRCYMLTLYQNGADGNTYEWKDAVWRLQTAGENPEIIVDGYGDWRPSDGPFVLNGASKYDERVFSLPEPTPTPSFQPYPVGGWTTDGSGNTVPVWEVTPTPGPGDHDDGNHVQTESGAGNETTSSRPPVIACPTPQPYDVWLANNPTPTPTPYAMCSGYPTPDPGQYDGHN